ncbi:amidohydrolase family protein [Luteimonas saliphila]|uniref:amidohydrolase family protein n=1 Tax=Luteimonas saliphila TaxID=2804919 RepID=UPI00192DE725|nr:amidohydrolase family protein [Luteimonas saliphila]
MIRALWLYLSLALVCISAQTASARDLAVVNARIVSAPDASPIARGTVLVRDGRIAAIGDAAEVDVPGDAEIVDAQGGTVVAGFWNSHVHLMAPPLDRASAHAGDVLSQTLTSAYLRWGFTTIFDIASAPGNAIALRERIAAGEVDGPHILTVDAPFFPKDGKPVYVPDELGGWAPRLAEVATPAEAAARARRQLDEGADGLKLFGGAIVGGEVGVLPMDLDVARAVVEVAHVAGKRVFVHPTNAEGIAVAIDSGADVLAHTAPQAGPWPEALLRRMVEDDMALVPTLSLFEVEMRKEGVPEAIIQREVGITKQQVAAFAAAGGAVLFGTDAGYVDAYDTSVELRLMHAAGMDWRRILDSMTAAPAAYFGHAQRKGRIAEGLDADLVVLRGDPAEDVAAFADVRYTLRGGRLVYRAETED